MRALPARFSRRGSAITLTVALALTVGADVAIAASGADGVAGIGGHGTSVAAERQYVKALRPVASRIYAAVSPAQDVVDRIVEPHAGDAFAARDALARGDSLSKLRAARRALARLDAPSALDAQQSKMLTGTAGMISSLAVLRSLAKDTNGTHVLAVVNRVGGTRMSTAELQYDTGLRAAFRSVGRTAPRDFGHVHMHPPVSQTGWIFGADRTCSAAVIQLAAVNKYRNVQSLSDAEHWSSLWMHGLGKAGRRLTSLPQPHGASALPRTLRARLHLLSYNAKIFSQQLAALHAQSISSLTKAAGEIHDVLPSLRALGAALRAYGAVDCGLVVAVWGSKHAPAAAQQSHHRSLST